MVKILLVEDNEINSDMLSRRLTKRNYEVILAQDGDEGILKAQQYRPDIILMDLSLPKIDGWEATKRIKDDPNTCNIPIIALTAHAMGEDKDKALLAGCDEYETKPIEIERLIAKIEIFLRNVRKVNSNGS
ncbi:response regulator [Candidatus Nucleicultrix amoebiphila]|uniref:Chemotaxis protein CheY n=1 Tax=Candidatus Nucleicultrix amoebiphila FS5 TaxID=1414854 RepID=A0A1W6N3X0_9PROT|nr:response regulator [Candidatus Nucleicultrix amoebiphila]ARN84476.1 chemotaxis protein CheY [Candidatus Nucleicultrix amoebiphila FS5]